MIPSIIFSWNFSPGQRQSFAVLLFLNALPYYFYIRLLRVVACLTIIYLC